MSGRAHALTPAGRAVIGGSAVLLAVGWWRGYPELWVAPAAGLTATAVAAVLALGWRLAPSRTTVERVVTPARVVRGESARAVLTAHVPASGRAAPATVVRDRVNGKPVDLRMPRIAAGGSQEVGYELPTRRRGIIEIGPLSEVRSDPFGLLQGHRNLGGTTSLKVYPRAHAVVPLSSGHRRDLDGPTSDGAAGTITFHSLREYVTGDDLRMVHWRSSARTGTLMVRQQADPSQPHTTVVLDTHPDSYPAGSGRAGATAAGAGPEPDDGDLFEAAIEAAASVLLASVRRNFPARLITGRGSSVGGRQVGQAAATSLLDHLTTLRPDGDRLGQVASRVAAEPGGNGLVLITGAPDPQDLMAMESLRHRYGAMAVVQFQPDGAAGAAWNRGVLDLVARSIGDFVSLWGAQV